VPSEGSEAAWEAQVVMADLEAVQAAWERSEWRSSL